MLGTIINVSAIAGGSFLGLLLKKGIPPRFSNTITHGLSLGIFLIGITMGIQTENILIPLVSVALGALIGEGLRVEQHLEHAGARLQDRFSQGDGSTFAEGFVTATLLYCTGSMAIMGSIADGISGDITILATKALLDGIFSIILTSTLGIGVLFSIIPLFIYQGCITMAAGVVEPFLTQSMIAEMNAVGGILMLGIAFNLLDIKKIALGNLLPSVFLPVPILWLLGMLPAWMGA